MTFGEREEIVEVYGGECGRMFGNGIWQTWTNWVDVGGLRGGVVEFIGWMGD